MYRGCPHPQIQKKIIIITSAVRLRHLNDFRNNGAKNVSHLYVFSLKSIGPFRVRWYLSQSVSNKCGLETWGKKKTSALTPSHHIPSRSTWCHNIVCLLWLVIIPRMLNWFDNVCFKPREGIVQDYSICSALAMETMQSCTEPTIPSFRSEIALWL